MYVPGNAVEVFQPGPCEYWAKDYEFAGTFVSRQGETLLKVRQLKGVFAGCLYNFPEHCVRLAAK